MSRGIPCRRESGSHRSCCRLLEQPILALCVSITCSRHACTLLHHMHWLQTVVSLANHMQHKQTTTLTHRQGHNIDHEHGRTAYRLQKLHVWT